MFACFANESHILLIEGVGAKTWSEGLELGPARLRREGRGGYRFLNSAQLTIAHTHIFRWVQYPVGELSSTQHGGCFI